eukprot:TRINITY_DN942_c0_g2_i1.p1 TRINITY_DN942_c0_g2~~TRINITY_DN942_c0_g2_i1.p1  ORF type:complete len:438 (-),score=92.08 TRINITY_DN942_c0_g2_i1:85-1398(-)
MGKGNDGLSAINVAASEYETKPFSPFTAFWNVVKAFAGAGSFALPWAVMNAGLWTGSIGFVVIAVLSNYTMRILLKCNLKALEDNPEKFGAKGPSYSDVCKLTLGRWGEVLSAVLMFIVTTSVCIAYLVLIGANMHELALSVRPEVFMWAVIPIVSLLTFLPDLKYLGFTSILGALSLILAMGTVIYYGFDNHLAQPLDTYPKITKPSLLALWFGTAAFFFCDHIIVVPIANASGSLKRFPKVLDGAMVFVTIVNVIFASMAYVFFGSNTADNVIANLPNGTFANIVRACICVELLFSFPLVSASGIQVLESSFRFFSNYFSAFPQREGYAQITIENNKKVLSRNPLFYVFRIAVNCLCALIASTVSEFGYFVSLVGALLLASSGFILPPLIYNIMFPKKNAQWVFHIVIFIFGVFATSLGTYQALDSIKKAKKKIK